MLDDREKVVRSCRRGGSLLRSGPNIDNNDGEFGMLEATAVNAASSCEVVLM